MKEKPTVRSVVGDKPAIWLRCTFAMMVEFFGVWLANAMLFPRYAAILPIAREAASVAGVATLVLIAFTASRRPILLDEQRISVASLASYSLAFALIVLGILRSDPLLLLIGAILRVVSTRWVTVLAGISLCCLRARACMLSIATAYCASYALRILFSHASFSACMVVLLLLPYLTYTACRPAALEILGAMRTSDPQAVSHITEPSSFLPLTHGLF
ncbi:MAG: helix-turn-helix transcriptional regulator, partial [Slackia sp.]|nr:helix-turn-helix transcriptional regulator [Slackia sp.]